MESTCGACPPLPVSRGEGGRPSEGYHDAGHEEAARGAQASVDDHEQQVGRAQDDEGLQGEVAVVSLADLKLQNSTKGSQSLRSEQHATRNHDRASEEGQCMYPCNCKVLMWQ